MEKSLPIYFMSANDYHKLEDAVVQLAGLLDIIYEKGFQAPKSEEDALLI